MLIAVLLSSRHLSSVEVRWMNLEPVIQSEVSQKEKNRYHVLMHIYGFWKNGADFQGRGRDTDVENGPVATAKQREGWDELGE